MRSSSFNSDYRATEKSVYRTFYFLKPFIPRSWQIIVRRKVARRKRKLNQHNWPIDNQVDIPSEGWAGWLAKSNLPLCFTMTSTLGKDMKNVINK